ncbi:MAG TPA: hypothetical protein VI894_00570 [Candidatus Nanoarchaeia archaeon]|nr:hypothetical protein [Candidatus Nanoarchaeia archaeon]
MKKIIIDTNFLMIPAQFKVDIFSEIRRICDFPYELHVLDKTIDELETIRVKSSRASLKDKKAAGLALKLIETKDINVMPTETYKIDVDSIILDMADPKNWIVATQDAELKKRLRLKKVKTITLRKRQKLEIVE